MLISEMVEVSDEPEVKVVRPDPHGSNGYAEPLGKRFYKATDRHRQLSFDLSQLFFRDGRFLDKLMQGFLSLGEPFCTVAEHLILDIDVRPRPHFPRQH